MKKFSLLLFALLALAAALMAHHGWAEFDSTSTITLQGIVTDFHFTNPHCVLEFRARNAKGELVLWQGEFASPGELARKGWNAATVQPGDHLSVSGNPAKSGSPAVHVTGIHLANGKELLVPYGN